VLTWRRDSAHDRTEPLRVVLVPASPGAVVIVEIQRTILSGFTAP
jgi:hypothetical protein